MRSDLAELAEKARRSLEAAHLLFQNGHYDFSASRAYYAMFYLAEAALLAKGLSFSSHGGVIAAFGEHFVKTGVFQKKLHEALRTAFGKRGIGDYEFVVFTREDAEALLGSAREFIDTVEAYLEKLSE